MGACMNKWQIDGQNWARAWFVILKLMYSPRYWPSNSSLGWVTRLVHKFRVGTPICWSLLYVSNFLKKLLKWGSEIGIHPNFDWSKRGWLENGPIFQLDLKSGIPTIWNLDKLLLFLNHRHYGPDLGYIVPFHSGFWTMFPNPDKIQ